jgi:hypothetical protein
MYIIVHMSKTKFINQIALFFVLCVSTFVFGSRVALADPLEDKSDAMTRLGKSDPAPVYSDHAIQFETPTGVASGETIVLTMPSDFDGTSLVVGDVALFEDTTPDDVCDGTEETLVASGAGVSEWNAVFSGTENRVLTITSGGASAIIAGASEVCLMIGENAGGANQYANPSTSGSFTITLSVGTGADTGDIAVRIIDNDRVTISATVDETITFTIDDADYAVGFGNLVADNARFATGNGVGADGPSATSAHDMTVSTNGLSGYEITYTGTALSTETSTIPGVTITGDEDGTPGTAQFAIGFSTSDDANIASAYDQATPTFNYSFVEATETPFISELGPTADETISAFYLANISGITPAGAYSTSLTYVATANF